MDQAGATPKQHSGWVGFDLDGTLAMYDGWKGADHIGEPIMPMVTFLKELLAGGIECRIFTARVNTVQQSHLDAMRAAEHIEKWCEQHIGVVLPVTFEKDFAMWCLFDDRAVAVELNTGKILGGAMRW